MDVLAEYTPDEVLPYTGKYEPPVTFFTPDGESYEVKMTSTRYQCFVQSRKCKGCGKEGTLMRLERLKGTYQRPHFNLYHVTDAGELILMTQDHVLPRKHGGKDHITNLVTSCYLCNHERGSSLTPLGSASESSEPSASEPTPPTS